MHPLDPTPRPAETTPLGFIDHPLQPLPRPATAHWATLTDLPARGDSANDFLVLGAALAESATSGRGAVH